jgi:transcriptional regulator with XRE-family HTH domain
VARGRRNHRLRLQRSLRGWTLEEVATGLHDAAVRLSEPEPGVDAHMVSRWERGARTPSARYVRLLCALFEQPPDELGLIATLPPDPRSGDPGDWEDDVKRRDFMHYVAAIGGGAVLDWERVSAMLADRRQPDEHTLDELDELIRDCARRFHTDTPGRSLPELRGHLASLRTMLGSPLPQETRVRVLRIASQAATLAGRCSRRADNRGDAYASYTLARDLAREAGDGPLQAQALIGTSMLYSTIPYGSWGGSPVRALALLDAADVASGPAGPPYVRTWLLARRAEERAAAGDALGAHRDLEAAVTALSAAAAPDDGLFSNWDGARLAGFEGSCARLLGERGAAVARLEESLATASAELVADRSSVQIDLAEVLVARREIDRVCALLIDALDSAQRTGLTSRLLRVAAVRRSLDPWSADRSVRRLDERLATLA